MDLATAVVMVEMTTGVVTTIDVATIETIATTIGGDEFRSLGINLHLTSACNLPVYPCQRPRLKRWGLIMLILRIL